MDIINKEYKYKMFTPLFTISLSIKFPFNKGLNNDIQPKTKVIITYNIKLNFLILR